MPQTTQLIGRLGWNCSRDTEGHRNYNIDWLVEAINAQIGPDRVLLTPGLPLPGSKWVFGTGALDIYARCRWDMEVSEYEQLKPGEPCRFWKVGQKFSTNPEKKNNQNPGGSQGKGDPLDIKDIISGGSITYQEEAIRDKNGDAIKSTSHEPLKGPNVEIDQSRASISIEQKRLSLQWTLCQGMLNTLNDRPLWGFPVRSIKLNKFDWNLLYYQDSTSYFSRKFEFEIRTRIDTTAVGNPTIGGWDRLVTDEGSKVIRGSWNRNPLSAQWRRWIVDTGANKNRAVEFVKFKDYEGNLTRTILANGEPFDSNIHLTQDAKILVEFYRESNFSLLGIPNNPDLP